MQASRAEEGQKKSAKPPAQPAAQEGLPEPTPATSTPKQIGRGAHTKDITRCGQPVNRQAESNPRGEVSAAAKRKQSDEIAPPAKSRIQALQRRLTEELGIERRREEDLAESRMMKQRIRPTAVNSLPQPASSDSREKPLIETKRTSGFNIVDFRTTKTKAPRVCFKLDENWTVRRHLVPYLSRQKEKTSEGFEGLTITKWYEPKDGGEKRCITQSFSTKVFNTLDQALHRMLCCQNEFRNKHHLGGGSFNPDQFLNDEWQIGPNMYDLSELGREDKFPSNVYRLENDYIIYRDENPWMKSRMPQGTVLPQDHIIIQKESDMEPDHLHAPKQFQFAIPMKLLGPLYVAIRIINRCVFIFIHSYCLLIHTL